MLRDIVFRGQTRKFGEKVNMNGDKLSSKWVYGGIFYGKGDFSIIYGGETETEIEKHVVYTDTVGQYTGLCDKNGKKIFEGDILEENRCRFLVVFDQNWAKFKLQHDGHAIQYPEWNRGTRMEIIGNIHDTPELIGGAI